MHESVLLQEAIAALDIDAAGVYVDGTFGRGGHASAIMAALGENGLLLAFDKDETAINTAMSLFGNDARFSIVHGSFSMMRQALEQKGLMGEVSGVLLDLGVSSPQLDEAGRGFSFLRDGPLDMRMDQTRGETAAQWLDRATLEEIRNVLRRYGEEKFAPLIARRITERRQQKSFETTLDLANFISDIVPNRAKEKGKHPATRSFQAIRIFINKELEDLELLLEDVVSILKPGGRLVIISFHSLEDRIVKHFIRDQQKGPQLPKHIPVMESRREPHLVAVGKPIKAGSEEVAGNTRARSAIMRVAEKVAA